MDCALSIIRVSLLRRSIPSCLPRQLSRQPTIRALARRARSFFTFHAERRRRLETQGNAPRQVSDRVHVSPATKPQQVEAPPDRGGRPPQILARVGGGGGYLTLIARNLGLRGGQDLRQLGHEFCWRRPAVVVGFAPPLLAHAKRKFIPLDAENFAALFDMLAPAGATADKRFDVTAVCFDV